jgi:hypothetical protein
MANLWSWLREHQQMLTWAGGLSVLLLVGSLLIVGVLLVRMPADYFSRDDEAFEPEQPVLRLVVRLIKNAIGVVLLVAGLAMLVLPGQGLLTILVALMLLRFPGKQRLQRWVLSREPVREAVDGLRARFGRPPLDLDEAPVSGPDAP